MKQFSNKAIFIFLLSPVLSLAQAGKSDTTQLKEIQIIENRLQMPFSKSTRNLQVITRQQIAEMPVKSVSEVLSYIGGADLRQRGPFGTQADLSIDGGTFEQTLILLNGVKISDPQTAHHSLNIPVPLSAIERIEVLRGPAARVYGINALTGAINIVTRAVSQSSIDVDLQTGSSFENKAPGDGSGIYGGMTAQVAINMAGKNSGHLVGFGLSDYNGQRYNSSAYDYKFFYQGDIDLDKQNKLNLMGGYLYNAFGANGYYAAPGDKEAFEIVKTGLFSVGSSHQLSQKFSLRPRVSGRYNWDDYRYYRNDLTKARSLHYNNVLSGELNSVLNTDFGDFGFGAETRAERINSSNIGNRNRYNHGLYAEFKPTAWQKLLLNIGAYVNYNTAYGWQWFPGVDASYIFATNWSLGANVGSSQRIPSFTDLYLNQPPSNIGNPNLVSENAWQYELSVKYQKGTTQFAAGYFYRDINNLIDWLRPNTIVPYQPQNLGNQRMNGVYVRWGQSVALGNQSSLGYTLSYQYLDPSQDVTPGLISKYVLENLKHQAILGLNYRVNALQVGLMQRVLKRQLNKGYGLTDVKIGYQLKPFTVYAEANNVFGQDYVETGAVPLPKRWFILGFKKAFNLEK